MLPRHEHHDELDLVYDDEVTVLKKNTDGWWYGKRIVFNKRQDRSWFAEGWTHRSLSASSLADRGRTPLAH